FGHWPCRRKPGMERAALAPRRILSHAGRHAAGRRLPGRTLAGDAALLPAPGRAGRAVLCRRVEHDGQGADPGGQAAGAAGRGADGDPRPRAAGRPRRRAVTGASKTACVIGSDFGGLALAIRLQAAGVQTTLVEARDKPGGRAYYW